jgi:hypothetical protein
MEFVMRILSIPSSTSKDKVSSIVRLQPFRYYVRFNFLNPQFFNWVKANYRNKIIAIVFTFIDFIN